jgi:predicted nucleic acid-binding protein
VSLVLDASLTLSWYFEDERSDATDALMDRVAADGAVVPPLWRYEVANGFLMAVRRKRVTQAYRDASLADLRFFPIAVDRGDGNAAWSSMLSLADRFELTVYDATYLELAERCGLPLATTHRALRVAAQALKIDVLG